MTSEAVHFGGTHHHDVMAVGMTYDWWRGLGTNHLHPKSRRKKAEAHLPPSCYINKTIGIIEESDGCVNLEVFNVSATFNALD